MKKVKVNVCDLWKTICIISVMILVPILGTRIYKGVDFQRECKNHILRAGNAANAQISSEELGIAIAEMEKRGLTKGDSTLFLFCEKDSIENAYNSLVEFKRSFEDFDSNVNSEVYNVELNALQNRLNQNSLPDMMSLGAEHCFKLVYLAAWLICIVCTLIFWKISDTYRLCSESDQKMISIYVPSFIKKGKTIKK